MRRDAEWPPDPVERPLGGQHDPEARPERAHDADRKSNAAAFERARPDLVADHRELGERGLDRFPTKAGVAREDVAEHRGQDEQKRKEREKGPVGDQRREVAAVVVAELLDDAARRRQRRMPPLIAIEGSQWPL